MYSIHDRMCIQMYDMYAEIMEEADLLAKAKEAVTYILENDPDLTHPGNSSIKTVIDAILAKPMD